MLCHYAVDFGTTNTVIASDRDEVVTPLLLPSVCAERNGTPIVPSAVCFRDGARLPFVGRLAVEQNALGRHPGFAQGFKRRLGRSSRRPTARRLQREIDAGECAEAFFSGLRQAVRDERRPRRRGVLGWWDDIAEKRYPLVWDLTLSVPVDAEESFRREMLQLGSRLGARTIRLIDEPVAAALGDGVSIERERTLLVWTGAVGLSTWP